MSHVMTFLEQAHRLRRVAKADDGSVSCGDEDARFGECHAVQDGRRGQSALSLFRPVLSGGNPEYPRTMIVHGLCERLPAGTQAVCVKTPTGHVTEIAIPGAYLDGQQGRAWQEFRLGLAVDDSDVPGEAVQLWWLPDWRRSQHIPGSGTFRRR